MINHVDFLLKDLEKIVKDHKIVLTWTREKIPASFSDIENCINMSIAYGNIHFNEASEMCPVCFGTTFMRIITNPFFQSCNYCHGQGYIDWVDKVLKGK